MSEVATGAAPAQAPNPAATQAPAPAAVPAQSAPAPVPSAGDSSAAAAARIELNKLDPNTIVVMPVNGRDVEMTAANALRMLGRGESATQKFEEASKLRRETEQLARELAENIGNPAALRALLAEAGMSPRQIAQAILQAEEQEANLTPEQRRLREYEQRIQQMQAEQQAQQQQRYEAERNHLAQAYRQSFNEAMSHAGVPAEAQGVRDILLPQLARAATQIQQLEGRMMTVREARETARELFGQLQSVRPAETDDQRRARITAEDIAWYQQQQAAQRKQAMPPVPRDQQGRFTRQEQRAEQQVRRDVNGRRIVVNMSDAWGGR